MADIGPQLPPHLRKNKEEEDENISTNKASSIGPQLPPHLRKETNESEVETREESDLQEEEVYGPCLPQVKKQEKRIVGPSLPPGLKQSRDDDDSDSDSDDVIGPAMPTNSNDEIDTKTRIRMEFEERAESMKNALEGKSIGNKKLERESWMTELPPELSKNFGLGPRKFRAKDVEVGDRSVWTDTPADKEKKRNEARASYESQVGEKRKVNVKEITQEEIEMQNRVKEYNEKIRPQSLLEMHQNKQKKNDGPTERRPFDRDRDLAINRTNPKQRAEFISKAKGLNSKFSQGNFENKFL